MDIGLKFQQYTSCEYSHCLQYLMQPNVISDVENVIHTALVLEKRSRHRKTRRMSSPSETPWNHPTAIETLKPMSPIQTFSQNPIVDSNKPNSATRFIPSFHSSKSASDDPPKGCEMDVCPGKETRERFDENAQMQKHCAEFMTKFINRIQDRVCKLQLPNEEDLLIQLSGLKQIAKVLEGKLAFDDDSFEALLDYHATGKSNENNNNDVTFTL